MQYLDAISKIIEGSLFISKASPSNHSNCDSTTDVPTTDAEEADQFYEDLQVLFITGD